MNRDFRMGAVSQIQTKKDRTTADNKRKSGKLRGYKRKLRKEAQRMEKQRQEMLAKEEELQRKFQNSSFGNIETILKNVESANDQQARSETLFQLRRELQRKDELHKEEK